MLSQPGIAIGGLDWRFADPAADTLVGINFGALSMSPLARTLIARLGAARGLSDGDIQKMFDRLSGVSQLAISIRKVLSRAVTDVLVQRGNAEVVQSTVKNPGAEFSEKGYDRLVKLKRKYDPTNLFCMNQNIKP